MLARTANLEARISRVEFHVDGQAGHPPWEGKDRAPSTLRTSSNLGMVPNP